MMQKSQKKRAISPFTMGRSRSPVSNSSRSGSGRSTPSTNGYAMSLEERQASPAKDSPSQTPADRRSLASLGSSHGSAGCLTPSSTMEALTTPNLPMVVTIKKCQLVKRPPGSPVSGWGFVLRGTTSEFKSGTRVYTCHVEIVKDDGAAMNAGIREGDQILSVDGDIVRDQDHSTVVKTFQSRDQLDLAILPAKFKTSAQVRVTDFNRSSLYYMWALTMSIQSLEIVNVKLPKRTSLDILSDFSYIPSLRHLAINHCSLDSLSSLEGLVTLHRLESLSLAHNFLSTEAVNTQNSPLKALSALKRLDLSYNLLRTIPNAILTLTTLETLVLVENNIQEIEKSISALKKLSTLCIDGNLLVEVDHVLEVMPSLKMVTVADNQLQAEPYCIKHQAYTITCVEGNPYTMNNSKRSDQFLRRCVSVRGSGVFKSQENTQIKRISASYNNIDPLSLETLA